MDRRSFLTLLGGAAAAWPLAARAQRPRKVWRVGFLSGVTAAADLNRVDRLRRGFRELGYTEGSDFIIEPRWADNDYNRLPSLAAELVGLNVDVIVTAGTPTVLAAKQATATIPIVMAITGDPVAAGAVASLARPGGNITGQSFFGPELVAKRVQLLKEILPQMAQFALLINLDNPLNAKTTSGLMESTAQSLKLQYRPVSVSAPGQFAGAFDLIEQQRIQAVVLGEDGVITANYAQIASLALSRRLPSAGSPDAARLGVTIGYGIDNIAMYQSAAVFIDKIFKGAKPAELPIEQATRFQFVLNLKTTKALGLDVPTETLLRADELIE